MRALVLPVKHLVSDHRKSRVGQSLVLAVGKDFPGSLDYSCDSVTGLPNIDLFCSEYS